MPKFKNIRIKKPNGGTRLQRVQVLASGKFKFVKNLVKGGSKKKGSNKKKTTKKKTTRKSNPRKGGNPTPKNNKMTLSKGLDGWAFAGPIVDVGLTAVETDDPTQLSRGVSFAYTGISLDDGSFKAGRLARGWGGAVNRVIEKKVFKLAGVKQPPTEPKNLADGLRLLAYFGSSIQPAIENRDDTHALHNAVYEKQFGQNLDTGEWVPGVMLVEKDLPYIIVNKAIKFARENGIKIP